MMKLFLLLFLTVLCLPCPALSVTKASAARAHITVTELPSFGPGRLRDGPRLFVWRCTNHTAAALDLEIEVIPAYGKEGLRIVQRVTLTPLESREISILAPASDTGYSSLSFNVFSGSGAKIKINRWSRNYYPTGKLLSPAFRPDLAEYLFPEFAKSPLPVKEWPRDPRAYAGVSAIVLDSDDVPAPDVQRALRLAAARGTRILVMVMGEARWPSYAGKEIPGKAFVEKIGFGTWSVVRSQAVEGNPQWKSFIRRKHAAAKKGKYSREYKRTRWHENLDRYLSVRNSLQSMAVSITPGNPPIPMKMLTVIMILFVVIIGPVNYIILKKRHAELWCLVTIPALSLLFTGAVILGVICSDGVHSKGKGDAETIIDQTDGIAVSRGGFGIYSPFAAGEFKFSPDELLYFHTPGPIRGSVERNGYVYGGSLVRARMGFGYTVCKAEFRSEKIAVAEKEKSVEVVNGLGVKVDSLYLRSSKGGLFSLPAPLEPGARALLKPAAKLPSNMQSLEQGCYRAAVSQPLFIKPGLMPDRYEHKQSILGRWR